MTGISLNTIYCGDALTQLRILPDNCVDCCVTSPPYYGLRDYGTAQWKDGNPACPHSVREETNFENWKQSSNRGNSKPPKDVCPKCGAIRVDNQIGLEATPEAYIERLIKVFSEVKRVLKPNGTLWINIGDSYNGRGKANGCDLSNCIQKSNPHSQQIKPTRIKGLKPKDLIGIPWMLAFALRDAGWYLRQDIIWAKPNPMPESITDRCTKSHEYIFLLSKSVKYHFDHEAIMEQAAYDGRKDTIHKGISDKFSLNNKKYAKGYDVPKERWPNKIRGYSEKEGETGLLEQHHGGNIRPRLFGSKNQIGINRNDVDNMWIDRPARNKRDVWTVSTTPEKEAHFACFPQKLIMDCIKAGCPEGGIVLDPFMGSGTTAVVARKLNRNYIGIELNPDYIKIANNKLNRELGLFI